MSEAYPGPDRRRLTQKGVFSRAVNGLTARHVVDERKAFQREPDGLLDAFHTAVGLIRTWHNMGMPEDDQETWRIYFEHSPEMKPIRDQFAALPERKKPTT